MPQKTVNAQVLTQLVTAPTTFATTLLVAFVDLYGTEGLQWDPETIRMQFQEDLHVTLPDANFDRLMTAINLVTSDAFYKSLPDFINFCNILSGDSYDPTTWDPADSGEIAWGVTEGLLISPPDENDDSPFTEDIVAYIGKVLDAEGIINPPDILRIAVRDVDPSANAVAGYSDDPGMFEMISGVEADKTDDINNIIKTNLQQLSAQLQALPVRSGSTEGAVQKMLASLSQQDE